MPRRYPAGTKVIVNLTPIGPAIDGSQAQPMTLECNLDRMNSGDHNANIPLAAYRA